MLTDYTDYLTPYESADEFGISLTTVYNLLRAKKIPGFKVTVKPSADQISRGL